MPAETPKVTLAGINLGGSNAYAWPLVAGINPVDTQFEVSENTLKQLEAAGALGVSTDSPGVTYIVDRGNGRGSLTVKRLFVIDVLPGTLTNTRRIRVVDRRYLWTRTHVASTYNETRVTGETTVVNDGQNAETPDLVTDIIYAKHSLQDENTVWTADEVVKDVFRKATGTEPKMDVSFEGLPVDDLVIDDPGHLAIERVLSLIPGADVYVDYDGQMVIKDALDGSELEVFQRFEEFQQKQKTVRIADRKYTRPRSVVVLFTPEMDVRFDYSEAPTTTITNAEDTNRLHNVGQVNEIGLKVDGVTPSADLGDEVLPTGPGSWVKMVDLFTAWDTGPGTQATGKPARAMSFDILRKHLASNFRWVLREFLYDGGVPDPVWSRRVAAAAGSYRRHFRIAKNFMQRLASVKATRATMIYAPTGARSSSPVYSDYTMRPSSKGFMASDGEGAEHGVAVRGYAADLATATPAPVNVSMVNPGAGIFALSPKQTDTKGYYDAVFLGYPESFGTYTGVPLQGLDHRDRASSLQFAMGWDWVNYEADWNFSTVLSCVPNSPNDIGRFYAVEIDANTRDEDADALGPPQFVRVFPGVVTARFGWKDADLDATVGRIRGEVTTWPSVFVNEEQIQAVAQAAADRVYEGYKNRPIGTLSVDMATDVEPVGSITSVAQKMQGGATTTEISFGVVRTPADIWRYLDATTRRALLHSQLALVDQMSAAAGL